MNDDFSKSASRSTERTPPSAAASSSPDRTERAGEHKNPSEAEFLREQARQAREAMARSMELLKRNVVQTVSPAALGRSHPWVSIASAAAGGFLLVALAGRARSGRPKRDPLRELDERIASLRQRVDIALSGEPETRSEKNARKSGLVKGSLYYALRVLRPILLNTLASALTAKATVGPHASSNGHGGDPQWSQAPSEGGPTSM